MNSNDIREILAGTFAIPAERTYWEDQLVKKLRQESIPTPPAAMRLPNMEVA